MRSTIALFAAMIALSPLQATAQSPPAGISMDEMAEVLRKDGYSVTINADGDTPTISTSTEGVKWRVYFYECRESNDEPGKRCNSIQFALGYEKSSIKPAQIGEWNEKKRFGRVYKSSKNGDLWVEMDVDVEVGATQAVLDNNLERWKVVFNEFRQFANSGKVP